MCGSVIFSVGFVLLSLGLKWMPNDKEVTKRLRLLRKRINEALEAR